MLFNLFLLLIIGIAALMFLVGLVLIVYGRIKRNNALGVGLIFSGVPLGLFVLFFGYKLFIEVFAAKPNDKELVGVYHLVAVSNLDIDKSTFNNYTLRLYSDKTFRLSKTPYVELCDSGKFSVEYSFMNENTFWLRCDKLGIYGDARIDRHFGSYRVEFVIGDPDSEESIFFEKI